MFFVRYFARMRDASAWSPRTRACSSCRPVHSAGSFARSCPSASAAAVSIVVPDGSTKVSDCSVWYAFCATPQHIPLELLETMPPIVQVLIEAGSGPIFALYGFRTALTIAPIAPGCARTRRPLSSTRTPRQWRAVSTSRPSVIAWPDRLEPAARNVIGTRDSRLARNSARTSSWLEERITARGTRR